MHISRHGDLVEVQLTGELDLATAPVLRERLATVAMGRAVCVALDLSRLGFIDGAGLSTILDARRALRSRLSDLTIRSPSRSVRRILEITGHTGLVAASHPAR